MLRTFKGLVDTKTFNSLGIVVKVAGNKQKPNNLITALGLNPKILSTSKGFKNIQCSYKKCVKSTLLFLCTFLTLF